MLLQFTHLDSPRRHHTEVTLPVCDKARSLFSRQASEKSVRRHKERATVCGHHL